MPWTLDLLKLKQGIIKEIILLLQSFNVLTIINLFNFVLSPSIHPYNSKDKDSSEVSADDFFTGQGSPAAVHRLIAGNDSNYKLIEGYLYLSIFLPFA